MPSMPLSKVFAPVESLKLNQAPTRFWFASSLIAPLYFGIISLYYAFTQKYIIQDDARQHVVWLQKYVDPELFPNDLIANYFQTAAPAGYKFCYWAMAKLGVEPIALAKILPLILGLITTVYIFKFFLRILPIPSGAFLATLLLNHNFWLKDDVISATPRAFLYPLFAAFLYYLSKRSLFPLLLSIALQGLFFPQFAIVEISILTVRLIGWQNGRPRLSHIKENYLFWLAGLGTAAIVILPFALNISEFGTLVTAAQMRSMPEFNANGRSQYFGVDPFYFMFAGGSGIRIPLVPPIMWSSFGLPFVLKSRWLRRGFAESPVAKQVTPEVYILLQTILASFGLFSLAHVLLLKLYFPSRYTYHSLRFVMAIGAGIVLLVLLESRWRWLRQKLQNKSRFSIRETLLLGLGGLFIALTIILPAIPWVFLQFEAWIIGQAPPIYEFLLTQPKDTLVASIAKEASSIPAFAQRSVLVGDEFMFAYHPKYYNRLQQRTVDIIRAQYASDLAETKSVIDRYGIDFFLIERSAFDRTYLAKKNWLIYSSFAAVVRQKSAELQQEKQPAIVDLIDRCKAASTNRLILLDANCLKSTLP